MCRKTESVNEDYKSDPHAESGALASHLAFSAIAVDVEVLHNIFLDMLFICSLAKRDK